MQPNLLATKRIILLSFLTIALSLTFKDKTYSQIFRDNFSSEPWSNHPKFFNHAELITSFPINTPAKFSQSGSFEDYYAQKVVNFDVNSLVKPKFRLGQGVSLWLKLAQLDQETRLTFNYGMEGYLILWDYSPFIASYNENLYGESNLTPFSMIYGLPLSLSFRFGREGDPENTDRHLSTVMGGGLMPYLSINVDHDAVLVGKGVRPFIFVDFGVFTSWRNYKIRGTYYFGSMEYANSEKNFLGIARMSQYDYTHNSLKGSGGTFAISLILVPWVKDDEGW